MQHASACPRAPARIAVSVLTVAIVAGCSSATTTERPDVGHGRFGVTVDAPVTRYRVTAATFAEIQAEIRRHGPRINGRQWAGATSYNMRWTYVTRPNPLTGCELRDIRIALAAAITMPEWLPEEEADDETKLWWRRFERGLMDHEAGHARLAVNAANRLRDAMARLRAGDCATLQREANDLARRHLEQLRTAQESYDAETRHGGTQITAALRADGP